MEVGGGGDNSLPTFGKNVHVDFWCRGAAHALSKWDKLKLTKSSMHSRATLRSENFSLCSPPPHSCKETKDILQQTEVDLACSAAKNWKLCINFWYNYLQVMRLSCTNKNDLLLFLSDKKMEALCNISWMF